MPSIARFVRTRRPPETRGRGRDPGMTIELGQLRFCRGEGRGRVGHRRFSTVGNVGRRRSTSASTLSGSAAARDRKTPVPAQYGSGTLRDQPRQPLKKRWSRVGIRHCSASSRLGGDSSTVQRVRRATQRLILHVEKIVELLVEPLRPEVTTGLGVDKLHVTRMRVPRRAGHCPRGHTGRFNSSPIVFTSIGLPL